jgi:hypothetical protein
LTRVPRGEPAGTAARPPRLSAALRPAVTGYVEWFGVMLPVNAAWLVIVGAAVALVSVVPVLVIALPLLALPTTAMMRLAVTAVRAGVPTLRMARDEVGRHAGRKLAIAAAQLVLLGLGLTSISLAGSIGGVMGILSAIVAGYVVIGSSVIVTALWPIVCDPARDVPAAQQLRLALAVVVRRPLQMGVLALIGFLSVAVSFRLIVPGLILPGLALLIVAAFVVPAADELLDPDG